MATPEDIESRLSAVERGVAELREQTRLTSTDASAARTLAAGADRDVSEVRAELRAHTRALNALRETQLELGHGMAGLEGGMAGLEGRMVGLEGGMAGLEGGMAGLEGRMDGLEGRIAGLDQTMTQGFTTLGTGMSQILSLLEDRDA